MDSNGAMGDGHISTKFKSAVEDNDKIPKQHESEVISGSKQGGVVNVIVSGLALFSDGYNAQISMYFGLCFLTVLQQPLTFIKSIVGYMEPLFSVL
jgi:hypothetical protein